MGGVLYRFDLKQFNSNTHQNVLLCPPLKLVIQSFHYFYFFVLLQIFQCGHILVLCGKFVLFCLFLPLFCRTPVELSVSIVGEEHKVSVGQVSILRAQCA